MEFVRYFSFLKMRIAVSDAGMKNERCRNILAGRHNGKTEGSFEKEI
jgi:hypothetical protein